MQRLHTNMLCLPASLLSVQSNTCRDWCMHSTGNTMSKSSQNAQHSNECSLVQTGLHLPPCHRCHLWGQTSSKQRHSESPSFHRTRSLPSNLMALGLWVSRSLASATGYHCLVQEYEGWLPLWSGAVSFPAYQQVYSSIALTSNQHAKLVLAVALF